MNGDETMNFRDAVKMIKALVEKNTAYQAARPAMSEVHGLARAVVMTTQGYTGIPADMVAAIAEANAHRFIKSYLCV